MYLGIHSLFHEAQNWAHLHPVSTNHPQCFFVLIWVHLGCIQTIGHALEKETPVCVRSQCWQCMPKELSVDLQDGIVMRLKSGKGYRKTSAGLKYLKSTVSSIIHKNHLAFIVHYVDEGHSLVKGTSGVCQKAPEGLLRNKVIWSDETKIQPFGVNARHRRHVWRKPGSPHYQVNTTPIVYYLLTVR